MKRVSILGSTGSIGVQTLDVVAAHPSRFEVVALAAGRRVDRLVEQIRQFRPRVVSVADPLAVAEVEAALGIAGATDATDGRDAVRICSGARGLIEVATASADIVVAGLVGAVGLEPVLAAIREGTAIGLANKEVMVMAGALVRREAEIHGAEIIPVDSEHSAIFQCLTAGRREEVERLILTCSGGPFREWSVDRIEAASVEQALAHPNWSMGDKISIDSATLMNKGLEVIEARWLFDVPPDRVEVVVHPQSIVHSLVEFCDRSVMAQLGLPDMRVPIAVALAHPERVALDLPSLDLAEIARLDFERPDRERFPCLELAYRAVSGSEAAPAVLNAANEVAVAAFLEGQVPFPAIAALNGAVLDSHLAGHAGERVDDLEAIRAADASAREAANAWLSKASRDGASRVAMPSGKSVVPGSASWN